MKRASLRTRRGEKVSENPFEISYPISATPPQAIQVSVPGVYKVLVTIEA